MTDLHRKHPKLFRALFGTFFTMFSWISLEKTFSWLIKKTMHDDKIPTNDTLDEHIERLAFYLNSIWPLLNLIIRKKTINFFRYKLKSFAFKTLIFCLIIGMGVGLYKIYNLYIQKPKVVYVDSTPKKELTSKGLIKNKDAIFIPAERAVLNKDNLDYFASEFGIKYWYHVRKQIVAETGFTSEKCVKNHNLFGMTFPGQRETTAIREERGFSVYKHWVYSLYDYKLWQDIRMRSIPIKKGETYPEWLLRIKYAGSLEYVKTLNSIDWYSFKSEKY